EGEEGLYYVWQQNELRSLLSDQEYACLAPHYGFDREANFEGRWYPHVFQSLEQIAANIDLNAEQIHSLLESGREKLLAARKLRIRPATDSKILSSANALMIKGMALAGQSLQDDSLINSALQAVDFIRLNMWKDGRLYASHKDGQSLHNAYLDDYAFLLDALLHLLQVHWRSEDCQFAIQLADALLYRFEDPESGGFFFTEHEHEALIHRPKPTMDEAIPSGNGVAATALQRLGNLLGEPRYLLATERCLRACWMPISKLPYAHNALLTALEEYLYPAQTVVIRGTNEELSSWLTAATTLYAPRTQIYAIASSAAGLPSALAQKEATVTVCAYLCEGTQCQPVITDIKVLQSRLAPTAG
ncbi:MAG: thioredoxin domain-containing protein, partial [Gammaproteobacteria bacterium]|nr:thioredoxin domain-containing protein [Gammaproteobacteria bacterium]